MLSLHSLYSYSQAISFLLILWLEVTYLQLEATHLQLLTSHPFKTLQFDDLIRLIFSIVAATFCNQKLSHTIPKKYQRKNSRKYRSYLYKRKLKAIKFGEKTGTLLILVSLRNQDCHGYKVFSHSQYQSFHTINIKIRKKTFLRFFAVRGS